MKVSHNAAAWPAIKTELGPSGDHKSAPMNFANEFFPERRRTWCFSKAPGTLELPRKAGKPPAWDRYSHQHAHVPADVVDPFDPPGTYPLARNGVRERIRRKT